MNSLDGTAAAVERAVSGSSVRLCGLWRRLPARSTPRVNLAVCAIFKDEAHYLAEWVTFHRLMGVEEFYLYDNNSTDHWRAALMPELRSRVVHVKPWQVAPKDAQTSAYRDCLKRNWTQARWIAFIDIDEFLFSPLGRPLPEILADYAEWPGVAAAWRVYGTGGVAEQPTGLVTESFMWRAREDHFLSKYGKLIVNPMRTAPVVNSPHRFVHFSRRRPWSPTAAAVDEDRHPVISEECGARANVLRINHYYSRSEAEALAKWRRGSVTRGEVPPLSEMMDARLNEVHDDILLQVVPRLRAKLAARQRLAEHALEA